jgi:peptide deformylase
VADAARPLEIITVDSPRAAVLRRRAQPVRAVTREIQQLIDEMFDAMHAAHGIGLAAPQIGVGRRVIVIEFQKSRLALVDPEILRHEGEEIAAEACLSIPGWVGDVPRALKVAVRARNRRGRFVTINAESMLARILQHEIDHLDGILFPERIRDRSTYHHVDDAPSEVAAQEKSSS